MTDMLEPGDAPVTHDAAEHERLKERWRITGDYQTFTTWARAQGHRPPDDRDGWKITYVWGPDGEDIGLVWSAPKTSDDDADDFAPDDLITLPSGETVRMADLAGPGGH